MAGCDHANPDFAAGHLAVSVFVRLSEADEREHADAQREALEARAKAMGKRLEWWFRDALREIRQSGRMPHWQRACAACGVVQTTSVNPAHFDHPDGDRCASRPLPEAES